MLGLTDGNALWRPLLQLLLETLTAQIYITLRRSNPGLPSDPRSTSTCILAAMSQSQDVLDQALVEQA